MDIRDFRVDLREVKKGMHFINDSFESMKSKLQAFFDSVACDLK